jgi:hypothetical protein
VLLSEIETASATLIALAIADDAVLDDAFAVTFAALHFSLRATSTKRQQSERRAPE